MNDNLLTQAIYRIIYCVVAGFAIILTLGFFSVKGTAEFTLSDNFWQFYTNLSNYYCFGIGVAVCASTVAKLRRGERRGHNTCAPKLKFCGVVMILVTFLVYATLLGHVWEANFWNSLGNLCYHVAAPVLFVLDFFLFDEHGTLNVTDPLKTLVMPLIYVVYILIYGAASRAAGTPFEYPYFFLDVDGVTVTGEATGKGIGYGGVVMWVAILVVIFTVIGYLLFLYNRLVKKYGKWKLDFKGCVPEIFRKK